MAFLKGPSPSANLCAARQWLGALFLLLTTAVPGQTPSVEYRIKAAYMFNFAKFVSWPQNVFPAPDSPIVIGILGKDPFGAEIDHTVAGKTIDLRPLLIRRLAETEPLGGCHILFVADSERKRLPQILESIRGLPILTVAEMEEFTGAGGMIRFVKRENTIRFEIDLEPVNAAALKISSKALQVALVKGKTEK